MRTRHAHLLFVCLVLPAMMSAQQSPSIPTSVAATASEAQAVAVVQSALSALTGGVIVNDVTLIGTAHRIAGSDDETGTATMRGTALGDSRVDLSLQSGNRSEVRSHAAVPLPGILPTSVPTALAQTPQSAGAWSGSDGILHGMAGHNIMTTAAWFSPTLILESLSSAQNYVFSYVGQETRNGASVLHLSASQPFAQLAQSSLASNSAGPGPAQFQELVRHLSRMDFYIDPNSSLPVELDFNAHPDNNASIDIATEILFSDYQKTNGVVIPLHVQKYLNNGLVLDLQFTNVTLNTGLSNSVFALQ
ncbi:MAG: hypothetical protein WBP92_02620 [Candidatus Acidiferrales bacterium]